MLFIPLTSVGDCHQNLEYTSHLIWLFLRVIFFSEVFGEFISREKFLFYYCWLLEMLVYECRYWFYLVNIWGSYWFLNPTLLLTCWWTFDKSLHLFVSSAAHTALLWYNSTPHSRSAFWSICTMHFWLPHITLGLPNGFGIVWIVPGIGFSILFCKPLFSRR